MTESNESKNMSEENVKVSKLYQENIDYMNKELGVPDNYDIILREMSIGGKKVAIYSVNGMVNTQVSSIILESLVELERADLVVNALTKLVKGRIVDLQVSEVETMDKVFYFLLSGPMVIFVEGQEKVIVVDVRAFPARAPQEPDIEKVTRGSRDGFVETMVFNTALIRRRLRDPKLRMKLVQVGTRSKTDVCIAYIEDVTNLELVRKITEELQGIVVDGIPMAEKSIEEFILGSKFWNPYPRVRYTERPDVAATHLLEGHVILIVDTSPSVIIAPVTIWHHLQHAEEYRQEPIVGAYLRLVRFLGIFVSVFLLPLWLAAALNPNVLPEWLQWLGISEPGKVGLLPQILVAEFGVDLLRMAAIHIPSPLSTALGLVATFMLGDIAIKVGLFTPEIVLYIAIVSVGTFATPSYELGQANRLARLFLVIATFIGNFIGFGIGIIAVFILLVRTKSFGIPYLWPVFPFDGKAIGKALFRSPVTLQNTRPSILKPQDESRQPKKKEK